MRSVVISRLVMAQRIIIVLTTNALGCDHNICMEDGIDLNKYFIYNLMYQTLCMRILSPDRP